MAGAPAVGASNPMLEDNSDDDDDSAGAMNNRRKLLKNQQSSYLAENRKIPIKVFEYYKHRTQWTFLQNMSKFLGINQSDSEIFFILNKELEAKKEEEWNDRNFAFCRVLMKDFDFLKRVLRKPNSEFLLCLSDAMGGSLVHLVYEKEEYAFGHYLVENFPIECVSPYKAESTLEGVRPEHMPFTGETILHLAIIRRNHTEVRWLLDFYLQHRHSTLVREATNALQSLLQSRATGLFFSRSSDFYVGETPLHFATCSNDTDMFDLLLSYTSIESPNALFSRDSFGNTILHLCVLRGHQSMFSHALQTVQVFIAKQIRNRVMEQEVLIRKGDGVTREDYFTLDIGVNVLQDPDTKGYSPIPTALQLPSFTSAGSLELWIQKTADTKLSELILEVLNDDGHSLLTLAAYGKRVAMLDFLIKQLHVSELSFGPQNFYLIDLDGFEQPHVREDYVPAIPRSITLYSAIEWLCCVNGLSSGDAANPPEGFEIEAIQKLIEAKWERVGKPVFMHRFFISFCIMVLITILCCIPDQNPSLVRGGTGVGVAILYMITIALQTHLVLGEVRFMHLYGYLRGAAKVEKWCGLAMFISFSFLCIYKIAAYYNNEKYYEPHTPSRPYPRFDVPGIQISLTIASLSSWMNMYYFLMGFESTGPFVLKIYTIISKDVPYFMQYYIIILCALSTVIAMLTDDGNPANGAGFYRLIVTLWTLFKLTVGGQDDYNMTSIWDVPVDLRWLFDVVLTLFRVAAVLLMINLLIAIIGNTFGAYTAVAYQILLMEKYNIMCAQELCGPRAKNDTLLKYAINKKKDTVYVIPGSTSSENNENFRVAEDYSIWYFKLEEVNLEWWENKNMKRDNYDKSVEKAILLILDAQNSFHPANTHRPNGSLAVSGANEDSARIADMIRRNIYNIDEIYLSQDTHNRYDIGHAIFWVDKSGQHPMPGEEFSFADIEAKRLVPSNDDAFLTKYKRVKKYAKYLEAKGNFKMRIWPEHCIIGTQGHNIVKEINDACQEWVRCTSRELSYVPKGSNPYTEMYSALAAEVPDTLDKTTCMNLELIGQLKLADKLIICGQALSHTVNYTCRDLLKHIEASKLYLLIDGTSPVPNFEAEAEEFVRWFRKQGGHVLSTAEVFQGAKPSIPPKADHQITSLASMRKANSLMTSSSTKMNPASFSSNHVLQTLSEESSDAYSIHPVLDVNFAYCLLQDPSNFISSAGLATELANLGVNGPNDLLHTSPASRLRVSKHLKEVPASKFMSAFRV